MAVSGGSIVGLGTRDELDGLIGPSTRIVAPDGVVIPGLVEPHMHIWTSLLNLDWTDSSHAACPTFDDVVAAVRQGAAQTSPGEPLLLQAVRPQPVPG